MIFLVELKDKYKSTEICSYKYKFIYIATDPYTSVDYS